ncbi:MAG: sporulation protein [Clostridiales bacterium]|nr:sporulation protein [Clostridiales bacterium]
MGDAFNSNLDSLFSKMENFISTKTVVGDPITVGDITMLPLIDVSFGVGAGASGNKGEKDSKGKNLGGLGAKIAPSAILVIQNGTVQLVNVRNTGSVDKLLNMVPGILSKFNLKTGFNAEQEKTNNMEENPV